MWLARWRTARALKRKAIAEARWCEVLAALPFLADYEPAAQARLRVLCSLFLDSKQFTGANGFVVTDQVALLVAAQACLPLLYLAAPAQPWRALDWYRDFVGVVMQPSEVWAPRRAWDQAGVLHGYVELIQGEAMAGGPVMLSWPLVQQAGQEAAQGCNLVIHEFAHKLDMRDGAANGCPPLPAGFLGHSRSATAYQLWRESWQQAYRDFGEQVALHQRFGAPAPWLDAYAASAPEEFFAVCCEAYFVNRRAFERDFPQLLILLDGFFRRPQSQP
jgi:Mlc titration factor MtfA (ptsG expression regulator)